MIKTYNLKDISIGDILARDEEKTNVADIVASVIDNVRKNGDWRNTPKSSTR